MELIDKEVIISLLNGWAKDYYEEDEYRIGNVLKNFVTNLRYVKTTDGLVHAKWINEKGKLKCSVCDCYAKWSSDEGGWWSMDDSKYCPNCGAKMDVQED